MTRALPHSIDDLSHAELLALIILRGLAAGLNRRADLLYVRHATLQAAAHQAENAASAAQSEYIDALLHRSPASDTVRAPLSPPRGDAKRLKAERARLAADEACHAALLARNSAERRAAKARAASDAAWVAWLAETGL